MRVILQDFARWRLPYKNFKERGYLARSCKSEVIVITYAFQSKFFENMFFDLNGVFHQLLQFYCLNFDFLLFYQSLMNTVN